MIFNICFSYTEFFTLLSFQISTSHRSLTFHLQEQFLYLNGWVIMEYLILLLLHLLLFIHI
jgi:hypothetical protein